MKKKITAALLTMVMLLTAGCSADTKGENMTTDCAPMDNGMNGIQAKEGAALEESFDGCPSTYLPEGFSTAEYKDIEEAGFKSVLASPFSTFSADVDTASYSLVRSYIENGMEIPAEAVRSEEMLNYFRYDYEKPSGDEPFSVTTELSYCPWNENTELLQIGLQAKDIDYSSMPNSNIVFLLDVSGSMDQPNKLPLLQKAFCMLTENLKKGDRVSVVTYAGSDAVLLDGATGDEKEEIISTIERLEAGGVTAGSKGIETAYKLAKKNFIKGGNNRVILATDGDMNVGVTSENALQRLIESKRDDGIYLTVLGFGTDNLKDNKLVSLADNGNGSYHFIDSALEAKRVLVDQLGGTLFTVAKDVKFQVEFNPQFVKGYRLIGYEKRALADEDFSDDTKDAGEMGAGHSVTALYEIVTVDSKMDLGEIDSKYQEIINGPSRKVLDKDKAELLTVNLRYKEPDSSESKLLSYPVTAGMYEESMSERMKFASAVAGFSMELRKSENYPEPLKDEFYNGLMNTELAENDFAKQEFLELVKKYHSASYEE